MTSSTWIAGRRAAPNNIDFRLFCFSHAGGGSSIYSPWRKAFTESVEVCPVLLPGREARVHEPPFQCMEDLIDPLVNSLVSELDRPFALFGHSLGSIVAFEVARRFEAMGHHPRALIVSGRRPPHLRSRRAPVYGSSDKEFIDAISRLGGTPEQVLRDEDLFRSFLPCLRADFQLNENYTPLLGGSLACPIHAFMGSHDPEVNETELIAWREVTSGHFVHEVLPGNHFYLQQETTALTESIARYLNIFSTTA